jgi:hypothetical protein
MHSSQPIEEPPQLTSLVQALNLDADTRTFALRLHSDYLKLKPDFNKTHVSVCCAVLIASRAVQHATVSGSTVQGTAISLSQLFKSVEGLQTREVMLTLRDFTKVMHIDESVYREVTKLTTMYAFSFTFFGKFEEIWEQAAVQAQDKALEEGLKETAWLLYVITRLKFAARSFEIVHCAHVLIGVIKYVLSRLPPTAECQLDQTSLAGELCRIVKANQSSAAVVISRVEGFISSLVQELGLRSEGVGHADNIKYNLAVMSTLYQELLLPDDIDERDFLINATSTEPARRAARPPMTPFKRQGRTMQPVIESARRLQWDSVDSSVGMTSDLKDLKFRAVGSPYLPTGTPMTLAMEMNHWLEDLTEAIEDNLELLPSFAELFGQDTDLLGFLRAKCAMFLELTTAELNSAGVGQNYSADFLNTHFMASLAPSTGSNNKALLTVKLYVRVLEKLLMAEQAKLDSSHRALKSVGSRAAESIRSIMENGSFHSALLGCCLETVLFVHNLTAVTLQDILRMTATSALDLWKIVNSFTNFDPKMPVPLRRHLRDIEVQIICEFGWETGSPVIQAIQLLIQSHEVSQLSPPSITEEDDESGQSAERPSESLHPSLQLFFRRVLSHAAHRIVELSDALRLEEPVREEIWQATKHVLSDHTELLIGRHIDQLICCSIFGVCKIMSSMSFNAIFASYGELYTEDAKLAIQTVRSEGGTTKPIVRFYNTNYLVEMKDYLTALSTRTLSSFAQPRIAELCPASPLRANLPPPAMMSHRPSPSPMRSPFRSPFMTPNTKRLWAFGESSASELRTINTLMQSSADRRLDFDAEERKHGSSRILEKLLKDEEKQPDIPFFRKEPSK